MEIATKEDVIRRAHARIGRSFSYWDCGGLLSSPCERVALIVLPPKRLVVVYAALTCIGSRGGSFKRGACFRRPSFARRGLEVKPQLCG